MWDFRRGYQVEELRSVSGMLVGRWIRPQSASHGRGHRSRRRDLGRSDSAPPPPKVVVDEWEKERRLVPTPEEPPRDSVMRRSLIAVHTLLAVDDGDVSCRCSTRRDGREEAVARLHQRRHVPRVDRRRTGDVMLSSPIILYDFPAIAPESAGDSATRPRSTRSWLCG